MGAETEWQFDKFDDGSIRLVGEVQLRKLERFLEEYGSQLREVEQAFDEKTTDAWNVDLDPIALKLKPYEQSTLFNLIRTDNKVFNKIIAVFASLCCEMDQLKREAETKYYDALIFYAECDDQALPEEGSAQIHMGQLVSLLQELSCFVTRCYEVVRCTMMQLSSFYSANRNLSKLIDSTDVHFLPVFEHLGDLLAVLITLDEIVAVQPFLKEHFTLYKRMLTSVRHNPTRFEVEQDKLKPFEKLVIALEGKLLDGMVFQNCVEQRFDESNVHCTRNAMFAKEFSDMLQLAFAQVEPKLGESHEYDSRNKFVGICALFVLHFHLFRIIDKKFFKTLWDVYRKVPAVCLVNSNVVWFHTDFLVKRLPPILKSIDKKAEATVEALRNQYLAQKSQSLSRDVQMWSMQVSAWMSQMDSKGRQQEIGDVLESRCKLFVEGVYLVSYLSTQVQTLMNLHVALSKPVTKSSMLAMCRCIEMIKAIEGMFHRRSMLVAQLFNHLLQICTTRLLECVQLAKKRIISDKKYNEKRLDVLSGLVLAENVLVGPGTRERRLILQLALAVGSQMKSFRDQELAVLAAWMQRFDVISELTARMHQFSDASFVFHWRRTAFPIYLDDMLENVNDPSRLRYMFSALSDCTVRIQRVRHDSPERLLAAFDQETVGFLKKHLLLPLCTAIETDLRLSIHLHLKLDDRNPFKVGNRDLSAVLRVPPIRFFDRFINIKAHVESYLDRTFYNLTTVALHDWKTYSEMRNLATQKYQLELAEPHLPSQTLEQGLDVLEIMRNIHVFVSKYMYNLNNQIFVEMSSNNKHLNTINIRHIANSIRTHGSGIMNTTVNFTYQFLRKKFHIFSQFLFDEHIKSRLMKDLKFYRENKDKLNQMFPFERADKFCKGIRKLGLTPEGFSYLDQFRILVTQIGNAMGYIRMIRSGGLHCTSNAIRFVPDLDDIVKFGDLAQEDNLGSESVPAGRTLDNMTEALIKQFTEGTEYFRMLVDVFGTEFRSQKNMHLKNFFLIVPALTISFVEHLIAGKEKINKRNKIGAAFTDDGFVMGVAYILKLLDQYHEFDSLHWFQSVRAKYATDMRAVTQQQKTAGGRDDDKLDQTLSLTTKRLDTYLQEFNLAAYSLGSARIFFRADRTAADETLEEDQKKEAASQGLRH